MPRYGYSPQRPYGSQGYAPGTEGGVYNPRNQLFAPDEEVQKRKAEEAKAAGALPVPVPASALPKAPVLAPPAPAGAVMGQPPALPAPVPAVAAGQPVTPYAGPPRPYGALPASILPGSGAATGKGPLEVFIPRSPIPVPTAPAATEQPVPPAPWTPGGQGVSAPPIIPASAIDLKARPQVDWARVNAPGFAPLITPEQARPFAAPAVPTPAAAEDAAAREGLRAVLRDYRLPGPVPMQPPARSRFFGMSDADLGKLARSSAQPVPEIEAEIDRRIKAKAEADLVTLPGKRGRIVETPSGMAVEVGGTPERKLTKGEYQVEKDQERQAEAKRKEEKAATVTITKGRMDQAHLDLKAAQDALHAGQGTEEDVAAAQKLADSARKEWEKVVTSKDAPPLTDPADRLVVRHGVSYDKARQYINDAAKVLFGSLTSGGNADPRFIPAIPGMLSPVPNMEGAYIIDPTKAMPTAAAIDAGIARLGRTMSKPAATEAAIGFLTQHEDKPAFKAALEAWAKEHPAEWKKVGSAMPITAEPGTLPAPVAGGMSPTSELLANPNTPFLNAMQAQGVVPIPNAPGNLPPMGAASAAPTAPAPPPVAPATPRAAQSAAPVGVGQALQLRSQKALSEIDSGNTKFVDFSTFLDAVDVDPKTERFDVKGQEGNMARQAVHPIRKAYDLFTAPPSVPQSEEALPLFDSTYGKSVWKGLSTDQRVALVRAMKKAGAYDIMIKPRNDSGVQALLSMFAQK